MPEDLDHGSCVDAWLARIAPDDARAQVDAFEAALAALTDRAAVTLGEVTVAAIADRVLIVSGETHPELAALQLDENGRVRCEPLRGHDIASDALRAGMRFSLVELLRVIGDITADVLTPAMHAALAGAPVPANEQGSR
jgi:hypothetical protein